MIKSLSLVLALTGWMVFGISYFLLQGSVPNFSEHYFFKETKGKPLNIVLLYADDWSHKTLGAINPFVQTPNIDKMAKEGVLFTHNCVTTSICWMSRASLYTGQYASVHKTFQMEGTAMFEKRKWKKTLFPLLKQYGYHSGLVGKWGHYYHPPDVEEIFATFKPTQLSHVVVHNVRWTHVTDANERDALQFLDKRPRDKPFSLVVSFFATHAEDYTKEQYRPQKRTAGLYQNATVPVPKTATHEHFLKLPPFLQHPQNEARVRWNWRYKTPELYQEMMKKTYRMATEVDTAVGNILEKLREQNVLNNTLVIFTTDNGNLHGEHGLSEKCECIYCMLDSSSLLRNVCCVSFSFFSQNKYALYGI